MPLPQQFTARKSPQSAGMGPPPDEAPGALLSKLMESAPGHITVPSPRLDDNGQPLGELGIVCLTRAQIDECVANAEAYVSRLLKQRGKSFDHDEQRQVNQEAWSELYNDAKVVEVLYHACRDPEDLSKRLFRSPEDIRRHLTPDEVVFLAEHYDTVQRKYGPLWKLLTAEECDQWIDVLSRGAEDQFPFGSLSRGQLVQLLVSLAYRLRSLTTGTFSSGADCAGPTSETQASTEASPSKSDPPSDNQ